MQLVLLQAEGALRLSMLQAEVAFPFLLVATGELQGERSSCAMQQRGPPISVGKRSWHSLGCFSNCCCIGPDRGGAAQGGMAFNVKYIAFSLHSSDLKLLMSTPGSELRPLTGPWWLKHSSELLFPGGKGTDTLSAGRGLRPTTGQCLG